MKCQMQQKQAFGPPGLVIGYQNGAFGAPFSNTVPFLAKTVPQKVPFYGRPACICHSQIHNNEVISEQMGNIEKNLSIQYSYKDLFARVYIQHSSYQAMIYVNPIIKLRGCVYITGACIPLHCSGKNTNLYHLISTKLHFPLEWKKLECIALLLPSNDLRPSNYKTMHQQKKVSPTKLLGF